MTGASETGRGRPARAGPPALPASLLCPLQHEGLVPDQTWPRSCTPRPSTGNRAHGSQRPVFPQGAPWTPRMCPWARSGGPQGAMPWAGRLETCWVGEERGGGVGPWRPACTGSRVCRCHQQEQPGQVQALDPGEAACSGLIGAQGYSVAAWVPAWVPTWAGRSLRDLTQFGPSAPPTERPLRCWGRPNL